MPTNSPRARHPVIVVTSTLAIVFALVGLKWLLINHQDAGPGVHFFTPTLLQDVLLWGASPMTVAYVWLFDLVFFPARLLFTLVAWQVPYGGDAITLLVDLAAAAVQVPLMARYWRRRQRRMAGQP